MRPNKIDYREVARRANVSLATVYRIIGHNSSVNPEIEARTRRVAHELGIELRLKAKTSYTVAFLLANRPMLHPFHAQLLFGAQEFASEHDSHLLFYAFNYDAAVPPEELRLPLLIDRRGLVDGYVVGGINSPNLLELLAKTGVPFAVLANNVLGSWKPDQMDSVWMDDITGAYESTQYLQTLGHRAIWFLDNRKLPTARVYEGYARGMRDAGLEPRMIQNDSLNERDSGYLAAKSLLSAAKELTAVFCASDSVAHGAVEAIITCGLRIPEDISIIGFGDRPEAAAMRPPLTTVWGYPDQVGRRLGELVLNRINNPDAPPQNIVLPTRLVKRNSCAKAMSSDSFATSPQASFSTMALP